jgi:hypothetical protein
MRMTWFLINPRSNRASSAVPGHGGGRILALLGVFLQRVVRHESDAMWINRYEQFQYVIQVYRFSSTRLYYSGDADGLVPRRE